MSFVFRRTSGGIKVLRIHLFLILFYIEPMSLENRGFSDLITSMFLRVIMVGCIVDRPALLILM